MNFLHFVPILLKFVFLDFINMIIIIFSCRGILYVVLLNGRKQFGYERYNNTSYYK